MSLFRTIAYRSFVVASETLRQGRTGGGGGKREMPKLFCMRNNIIRMGAEAGGRGREPRLRESERGKEEKAKD